MDLKEVLSGKNMHQKRGCSDLGVGRGRKGLTLWNAALSGVDQQGHFWMAPAGNMLMTFLPVPLHLH